MKTTHRIATLLFAAILVLPFAGLHAAETVTVDNFVRAETDMTFDRYVKQGAFGKFLHIRTPTPIDKQDVTRDTRRQAEHFTAKYRSSDRTAADRATW